MITQENTQLLLDVAGKAVDYYNSNLSGFGFAKTQDSNDITISVSLKSCNSGTKIYINYGEVTVKHTFRGERLNGLIRATGLACSLMIEKLKIQ